jgi:hypothetical protein
MYWLKALALILVVAVFAHANCAVSCVHPHSGKAPAPESDSQSPENCHHSKAPDKSEKNESASTCSHTQISGDRPPITAKSFKPIPTITVAEVLLFSSGLGRISVVAEFYGPNSYASTPLITVLRV